MRQERLPDDSPDQGRSEESEQPVDEIPYEKTGEFADKEQHHCPAWSCPVESEGYCNHITDDRYPADQG